MADPSLALQGALVTLIKGKTEAGDRVYDRVPAKAEKPYVSLGPMDVIGSYADCYDGSETTAQIDVWGDGVGMPVVKRIASQIRDLINAEDYALDGHTLELGAVQSAVYSGDPNGITTRAVITARFLTQPQD